VRSSTQALPRDSRRLYGRARGSAGARDTRFPVQLELFGLRPAPSRDHPAPPPPAPPALPRRDSEPSRRASQSPETDLLRRLSRLTRGRLSTLTLTDNRRTILTVKNQRPGEPISLRIHRSFADAPEPVLRAVADFVESRKGSDRAREALAVIREHFTRHRAAAPVQSHRRPPLDPLGATLDLRVLRDELNRDFFGGRLKVDITWGKGGGTVSHRCRGRRARKSTIQLGSYSYEDNLIRVHRALDQGRVPRYVVEAVVYHELLHAALPPVFHQGRRYVHTPEFRRRERLYPLLDRAERWIEKHLPELLRASR
jgi:hypothetical protein